MNKQHPITTVLAFIGLVTSFTLAYALMTGEVMDFLGRDVFAFTFDTFKVLIISN
ncbi:hypothetical protein [Vibrio phage vB_VhaP_PG11]|nr:hypothetical protein [Vibrio phage vB_VhaP_PG11]